MNELKDTEWSWAQISGFWCAGVSVVPCMYFFCSALVSGTVRVLFEGRVKLAELMK